ncbi:MAG: proline dehydrogenase family protein, partial [Pseudomonadota bacterium]
MTISYEAPLNEDENTVIKRYLSQLEWNDALASEVSAETIDLIKAIRKTRRKPGSLESFFQQYSLNTEEGLALMSMAEALLRIPDSHVANKLIRDKIAGTNWLKNKSDDKDWLTKIAGVGLNISGSTMNSLLSKLGEPVIREAMVRAMKVLGKQFVVGETLPKAIKKSKSWEEKGFRFSYDILGEGARTFKDADYYFQNYKSALEDLSNNETATKKNFGISVKLSALHPRFELLHTDFCVPYLVDKLTELCEIASAKNLSFTIDAEEVARIYPTLKVFEGLLEKDFSKWEGLGIAIQAYHKSAISVIDYVYDIAQSKNKKIQVRLVKGAYWDTEIKHSQINGHDQYPVFTRKENSDLSYLLCAQKLFDYADHIYPMFGTHNAHTVAAIQKMAGKRSFEFQKLYGMG